MNAINTETQAAYFVTQTDDAIIAQAMSILDARMRQRDEAMSSPNTVKNYLRLKLNGLEHEVFCVLFLDNQNRVIEFEEMFRGTLSQASVYPREVVKAALAHNAAAVILAHNHPSGEPEPSRADTVLTDTLKNALALVDVKVLDHFIVGDTVLSFAERGLIGVASENGK
ncbi:MAG: RadC family protein [Acidithiobacillus sp.]